MDPIVALVGLTMLGAAVVGGIFYAFSSFVMSALAARPSAEGAAAMQSINVVVLNRSFLGVFAGTALLALGTAVYAVVIWGEPASLLLLGGAVLYLAGVFLVTGLGNVPLNDRLEALTVGTPEADDFWPIYLRRWTGWNHVRTAAGILSAACYAAALLGLGAG